MLEEQVGSGELLSRWTFGGASDLQAPIIMLNTASNAMPLLNAAGTKVADSAQALFIAIDLPRDWSNPGRT